MREREIFVAVACVFGLTSVPAQSAAKRRCLYSEVAAAATQSTVLKCRFCTRVVKTFF